MDGFTLMGETCVYNFSQLKHKEIIGFFRLSAAKWRKIRGGKTVGGYLKQGEQTAQKLTAE